MRENNFLTDKGNPLPINRISTCQMECCGPSVTPTLLQAGNNYKAATLIRLGHREKCTLTK